MAPILLSLAHFCDKHGPKIVLVTQGGDSQDPMGEDLLVPDYSTESYCESCLLHFPNENSNGVRSMRSFLNNLSFVTTQYSATKYQLLIYIIRKAFSEESMIYDGSPLVFFDDVRGLNLVIGFKLYDENARGNERRYCFILTIDSRDQEKSMQLLANHWNFIIGSFNKMITYIKTKHAQKLANDKETTVNNPFIENYLKVNKSKTSTNLIELTGDDSLFIRIHKWNAFLTSSLLPTSNK